MQRAWLVVVAACGSSPNPPVPVAAPRPVAPPAVPVAADPHNLDFEVIDGDLPKGWKSGTAAIATGSSHYTIAADKDAHHGSWSLKIASKADPPPNTFGAAAKAVDAAPYRGKHVRLHGWVKTTDVAGFASLWLRGDNGEHGFDNMAGRGVTGTTPWHEIVAETDLDPETQELVVGGLLVGTGAAWYDSLSIEVKEVEKPVPIVVGGRVLDSAHKPVAGAVVSLSDQAGVLQHVTSDASGAFLFHATSGALGVSAIHEPHVAAFLPPAVRRADVSNLELVLGDRDGETLHVRVTSATPIPAGTVATVTNVSNVEGDIWAVPVIDGAITVTLPPAVTHIVSFDGVIAGRAEIPGDKERIEGTIAATVLGPPPDAVTAYLRDHAASLVSPEAGHGFADMAPIGKMVGNAHIVGLGEATHGTREFFQLKHRFLEYLVAEKGFTVFAIEANQPECRAINAYIQNGTGDAKTALAGIYFWTWKTEEVLAMIEWMRAWNADPKHKRKLEFTGFDMQTAMVAHKSVADYLAKVAPDSVDAWKATELLSQRDAATAFPKATADERKAISAAVDSIAKSLDAHKADAIKKSSAGEFADARHDVTVLQQWLRMVGADAMMSQINVRDESMAANIAWLRAQHPADTKFVVWAHNGHVARNPGWMGSHLTKSFGKDYVIFGFVFGEGSFQAMTGRMGGQMKLTENTLWPAPEHDLSTPFTRTGKPLLVVDLRALPAGPIRQWFSEAHPMRDTGAVFTTEKAMSPLLEVMTRYDALIFVAKTTRARPITK